MNSMLGHLALLFSKTGADPLDPSADPYFGDVILVMDMQQDSPFLDKSIYSHSVVKTTGTSVANTGFPWGYSFTTNGTAGARLTITSTLFNIPAGVEFTLEVVVTRLSTGNDLVIDFGNNTYFTISPATGAMVFRHSGISYFLSGTCPLNTPTHFAFCLDMLATVPTLRVFAAGGPVLTSTHSSVSSGVVASSLCQIGANFSNASWQGYVHAVRFTRGVCRYRTGFAPPIAHFPESATPSVGGNRASIQALFANGIKGGFYDLTDETTLWQDAARTIPAALNGMVRGITDISGNGMHLSTGTTTFLLKNDGTRNYLECPGGSSLSGFSSAGVNMVAINGYLFAAAYRATEHIATMGLITADKSGQHLSNGLMLQSGANAGSASTSFYAISAVSGNTTYTVTETGIKAAGADVRLTFRFNSTGAVTRRDGTQVASVSINNASGVTNANNIVLNIASSWSNANSNGWTPFKGRMYIAMFIDDSISDAEVVMIESFMAAQAAIV
jgi:hypothetical protein